MEKFFVTAYGADGKHLVNETVEALDDRGAVEMGLQLLSDKQLTNHTSRIVRASGGLIHFHQ